jgi:circadian clock protein KaiB
MGQAAALSQPVLFAITHRLMLFVAGQELNSIEALQNLSTVCELELPGRYALRVINVFEEYELALAHRVLVTPCLVVEEPVPPVMIAGTLKDTDRLRTALRLD